MQEESFKIWLSVERELRTGTVGSRISDCKRVERYEGDLDNYYEADRLTGLIDRLNPKKPVHKVPINGNVYNGTATLKSAVNLYRDFRDAGGIKTNSAEVPHEKQRTQEKLRLRVGRTRHPGAGWPVWPQPNDEEMHALAQVMTPFVRFLDPSIVEAVTNDNRRMKADWSSRLKALGINPAIYLWEDSPCAFPGVRRYAGSTEIATFRKRVTADEMPPQCLALDDNDYPKQLWAYVLTGKPFRKRGPDGYQLAHLLDHKEHGNRWHDELNIPPGAKVPEPLFGLFTSAANSAYVPRAFLRSTDFSPRLRSLIQRRASQLYDAICRIVPPPLAVKPCEDQNWSLDEFRWSKPEGFMENVPDFLRFRRERIEELFKKRHEAQGTE
ncbi:MAG: hypothetical protein OXT64_16320 [Gammaproteobacteria bacterium]|nr:hypothetical protein [Gammaproteobacteria bacterium]